MPMSALLKSRLFDSEKEFENGKSIRDLLKVVFA